MQNLETIGQVLTNLHKIVANFSLSDIHGTPQSGLTILILPLNNT